MRIALVQQHATPDKAANLSRGLDNIRRAADAGANVVCFAELSFERFHPQRPSTGNLTQLAKPIPGPTTEAAQQIAQELGVVVLMNLSRIRWRAVL